MAVISQLTTYSTAGSSTYTIPEWASHIFVAALGGGGAGGSSNFAAWGGGGSAGAYDYGIMYRGQAFSTHYTLPLTVATLSVTVGAAGVGAATSSATNGGASIVSAAGIGTLYSGGGGARGSWDNNGPDGNDTSGFTFNGTISPAPRDITQVLPDSFGGRSGQADPANAALGSGGCGGKSNFGYGIGSNGRQGGVWILAYGDRPAFLTMM